MEIKSTLTLKNFTQDDIFPIEGKVNSMQIVSAYTDPDLIIKTLRYILKNGNQIDTPHFSIYLDYYSSRITTSDQIREQMLEVSELIRKKCDEESGVYLVKGGALFHSKFIISKSRNSMRLLLGSINFTSKGFNNNEEIAIVGDCDYNGQSYINKLIDQLKAYLDKLDCTQLKKSLKINKPLNLRQVLLSGSMYYELKEADPLRFKLCLPEEIREVEVNLDPMLDANLTDSISLVTLITSPVGHGGLGLNVDTDQKRNQKSHWKRWCAETCYGYWNPVEFRDNLENVLQKRKNERKPYYNNLFKIIRTKDTELQNSFMKFRGRIAEKVPLWKYADRSAALISWKKWYKNMLCKLDNESFTDRLITGIENAPTPDVWSDPTTAQELEDSFCESILYQWNKENKNTSSNTIAQIIGSNLEIEDIPDDGHELKMLIERWLKDNKQKSIFED